MCGTVKWYWKFKKYLSNRKFVNIVITCCGVINSLAEGLPSCCYLCLLRCCLCYCTEGQGPLLWVACPALAFMLLSDPVLKESCNLYLRCSNTPAMFGIWDSKAAGMAFDTCLHSHLSSSQFSTLLDHWNCYWWVHWRSERCFSGSPNLKSHCMADPLWNCGQRMLL